MCRLCTYAELEPSLKIVMTLLVRDEQDILRENLDFHLSRGVDFIIVTDNLSRDSTPAILDEYRRRGVVRVLHEPQDDYMQTAWVTRMARLAATEHGADWVINSDADEFWFPDIPGASLKDVFASSAAAMAAVSVARVNFPVVPTSLPLSAPFFERLTLRDTQSIQAAGKPLPPKVAHRANPLIEVDQGNHAVRCDGAVVDCGAVPLTILHFPIRSYAQFHNKIQLGGAAYARNTKLKRSVGATWRILYQALLDGRLPEEFRRLNPDDGEVDAQVSSGRLQHDVRLRDALRLIRESSGRLQ